MRKELRRYKNAEQKQGVQCEPAGEEGRFEEDEKMEVDDEVDSKTKLDERKEKAAKNSCETSRSSQMWSKVWWTGAKSSGSRSCTIRIKSEMISSLSTKGWTTGLKKLQSLQHKKKQCQKDAGKCDGDVVRIRDEIAEREVRLQELFEKSQRIHSAEADLDEEIRILQAGDERQTSCASQTNGCCFDPAVVEQFITMGAGLARQQTAFIHGEVSRVLVGQHQQQQAQPSRCTHREEEKGERK